MLSFAREVSTKNPSALVDVMRLFLRSLQSELLISAAGREMHHARQQEKALNFFAPKGPLALQSYWDEPRLPGDRFRVDLARDPVLPGPWKRSDYVNAIANIGTGKHLGPWRQDPNHSIVLWLPWGIPFVTGGNHSIATGIIAGEGTMVPVEVWDLSGWLDTMETDGKTYFDRATKKHLCKVVDPVRAAIFEVGRLMKAHDVVPMTVKDR